MYLISAYFDEQTNKILERYIKKIAEVTGNSFMTENHVPPHMTISALEVRDEEDLKRQMKYLCDRFYGGMISFVSVGALFPYVLYVTPVLSAHALVATCYHGKEA